MAITSKNDPNSLVQYKSTHFRYAVTYIVITFAVLLFLNIYSSKTNQALFYNSKQSSMLERCYLASTEISELQVINQNTVSEALSSISNLRVSRVIVTDEFAKIIYDSSTNSLEDQYALFPEIISSLSSNDVFSWKYSDSTMISKAATPIISYGSLIGCVYMMEYDTQQGALIHSLQVNTFYITMALELLLIVFSLLFSKRYTARVRKIMVSMRIIREGVYSHRVDIGGNDELTVLGEEFNDLIDRLRTSESKRRQFVSDASHELKTPLASIKLLSDSILQNEMDIETAKEFVEDIGNEAERLNRMSQKLLTLSGIEAQPESEYEITYIAPTVERVARMVSAIAAKNNIQINLELEKDSSILILEDDLYQIIFNLAENGIKYNVPGGKLTISLDRQEDTAILKVADTGVGIPEESLENIFERFYRVDKARSRQTGGSGLGLSIVRDIVQRNNGQIFVESTLGQGTVFTVHFPIFETEAEA